MSKTIEHKPLPYALDALEPHMSKETLEYHYGKHHRGYVEKLNGLVEDTELAGKDLVSIIISAPNQDVFNNAAQAWNHEFFWQCLSPRGGEPSDALTRAMVSRFGSIDAFKDKFTKIALGTFGSGWAWLVVQPDGELDVVSTANADTPVVTEARPLLTCDVWEHAYYIDHRNERPRYLEAFWKLVNWGFVSSCFAASSRHKVVADATA